MRTMRKRPRRSSPRRIRTLAAGEVLNFGPASTHLEPSLLARAHPGLLCGLQPSAVQVSLHQQQNRKFVFQGTDITDR